MIKMRLILFSSLFLGSPLFALWPTNGPQQIAGNYGTYEERFHDGIDVYGAAGVTEVVALSDVKVVDVQSLSGDSIYYVTFQNLNSPQEYFVYGHIRKLPNGPDLKSKDAGGTYDCLISSGQAFALIDFSTNALTTFPHTHLIISGDSLNWDSAARNPLASPLISPADPYNAYPEAGPIYFKRDNVYITTDTISYPDLWGRIEVISQITDFMGHNEDNPGNQVDTDTFHPGGLRYHGITSTPYKVEYSILDWQGNVVKSTEAYEFSGNPDDTRMATLYEHDKDVDANPDPAQFLPYNYVFNLTNAIEDRYWNTKLAASQSWNGSDAKINGIDSGSPHL